jgi:hypothetical protein
MPVRHKALEAADRHWLPLNAAHALCLALVFLRTDLPQMGAGRWEVMMS